MSPNRNSESGCCSSKFIVWIIIVYAIILFITGCFVVGVSVWTLFDPHQYVALLMSITYPTIVYLLFGAGALLIIVSILGLFAAAKENRKCLICFIFLLILIFVIEITVGLVSYVYREYVHYILESNLSESFMDKYGIVFSVTEAVDFLQEEFKCCGVLKYSDWNESSWMQDGITNANLVPDSCCISVMPECGRRTHPSNVYHEGCMETLEENMKNHLNIIGGVALGICILQVFGVIYALILYFKLRTKPPTVKKIKENQKPLIRQQDGSLYS